MTRKHLPHGRRRLRAALAGAFALALLALPASAFVHDALSFALEGAEAHVSEEAKDTDEGGYTLRKDFWQGVTPSGEGHAIKHQLIKGNSYWFWVGTDAEDVTMAIAIYDKEGNAHQVKVKRGKQWIGARIDVPKTGTYYVAFKITTKGNEEAHWAVAYAFK